MKRLVVCLAVLLMAAWAMAQNLPPGDPRNNGFVTHWTAVVQANPQITDFQRMPNGTTYNLPDGTSDRLTPGKYGIWGQEFRKWYGVSYEQYVQTHTVAPEQKTEFHLHKALPQNLGEIEIEQDWHPWLLLLVLLLALVLVGFWLFRRPTTWRPVVEGGVPNDAEASRLLSQAATARDATLIQGSQERVRLSGVWTVRHRGVPIPIPHRYESERAWRARFRMANGTEQVGYMLQACGNDVVFGGAWYTPLAGAHVEEGWGDEAPVQVAPPQQEVQLPPAEVPGVTSSATTEADGEQLPPGTVQFEFKKQTGSQPAMIRLRGVKAEEAVFTMGPDVMKLRYRTAPPTNVPAE